MSALFLANLVSPFALSRIQTVITFTVPLFGLRFQPATKLLHGRFLGDCIQSGRSSFLPLSPYDGDSQFPPCLFGETPVADFVERHGVFAL